MIGISFWRVIRAAWHNFWRNIWLSIATTVIMVITLLMVTFLYFATVLGGAVLHNIEQKVDLSVTFKPKVTEQYLNSIAAEIKTRPDVESVRVITSQQALEEFRDRHTDDPFIAESLQELEDNPLPASMFIVAKDPQQYQAISKQLEAEKYKAFVDKVNFEDSRPIIERLIGVIGATKQIGLLITVTFAGLAMLIMFNTVRLAIYSFREEIDIMRLVGAGNWFIQGPFIVESVLVALVAVAISTTLLYFSLRGVSAPIERFFFDQGGQPFNLYAYATANWAKVIGLQTLLAVALAVVSSMIGIRRYLRN